MNKKLVAYFSASGITKKVAEEIATIIEADIFQIEPKEKYTNEDLDWTNSESRSSIEMKNSIKPEIVSKVDNLDNYDTVILGFPIWWYKEPTIIDTFLDENDLSNKKVYVFVTSGSSTVDSTYKSIRTNYSNIEFIDAKRLTTNLDKNEILDWIK